MLYFVSEATHCKELQMKATTRLSTAYYPKTRQSYNRLFRVFLSFCECVKVSLHQLSVPIVLSFLEYLVANDVSVNMVIGILSSK